MSPRRMLEASQSLCAHCLMRQLGPKRGFTRSVDRFNEQESRLPRVINPSLWSALIPKAWRRSSDPDRLARRTAARAIGADERRTGIIFLVLGLVVGSNAIHLLNIKRDTLNYTRQTEAKLAALREVIQRVKNGENVDVKRVLGTGDAEQEAKWEEVIKELENTDTLWEGRKKREAERAEKASRKKVADEHDERATAEKTESRADNGGSSTSQSSGPRFSI